MADSKKPAPRAARELMQRVRQPDNALDRDLERLARLADAVITIAPIVKAAFARPPEPKPAPPESMDLNGTGAVLYQGCRECKRCAECGMPRRAHGVDAGHVRDA